MVPGGVWGTWGVVSGELGGAWGTWGNLEEPGGAWCTGQTGVPFHHQHTNWLADAGQVHLRLCACLWARETVHRPLKYPINGSPVEKPGLGPSTACTAWGPGRGQVPGSGRSGARDTQRRVPELRDLRTGSGETPGHREDRAGTTRCG